MPFEQGPIRPPNEAYSLLIRITRNCSWNRCVFCPVYKGEKFSRRSESEILNDIQELSEAIEWVKEFSWRTGEGGKVTRNVIEKIITTDFVTEAKLAAATWLYYGSGTVFLQDSDALILPQKQIIKILEELRRRIPGITRVTCYTRSCTLMRKGSKALEEIKMAGLDRVHVGLESGSAKVLELVKKGETPQTHIEGGRAAIESGLELSEYVMPGLGGVQFSKEHAIQTARVVKEISPHFLRLRSLGIRRGSPLFEMVKKNQFHPLHDDEVVREIRTLLENLSGTKTVIVSDHILNLLGDIEGKLPDDLNTMIVRIDSYLGMEKSLREIYRVGRRLGIFQTLSDINDPGKREIAETITSQAKLKHGGIDSFCARLIEKYI